MQNIINNTFSRTYNPNSEQNALSNIKKLLTSRDTLIQSKACGYICEVIKRYAENSPERSNMVEFLLHNDITVFLCEAMSNLDWTLFRCILQCLRLLWRSRNFFSEDHDAHASSAVVRALVNYAGASNHVAVDGCLLFLCDLLMGIRFFNLTSALSCDSSHSTDQLLACLNSIASKAPGRASTTLAAALVQSALLAHQTDSLRIKGHTSNALAVTVEVWLPLLLGTLNQVFLMEDDAGNIEVYYVIICQLGVDVLRLVRTLRESNKSSDFIQSILNDEQEVAMLMQSAGTMETSVHNTIMELVNFTKENHKQLPTEEYGIFLRFLYTFLTENNNIEALIDFSDVLFSKGYLSLLPQAHILRQDVVVRKVSTLVLGEILNFLSKKYLAVDNDHYTDSGSCMKTIQMGLVELQYGIEKPQTLGIQLQKSQSYSLVIYLYFYCQSTENPQEEMAPLLIHFVTHILRLKKSFKPPSYIIKCLWLVFAMSTISNASAKSLNDRIYLEKAIDRFVEMLHPTPAPYYTHNPALLLWVFTSQRIPTNIRICVLSQWLKIEDTLPLELATETAVWDLLLDILSQNHHSDILWNTMKALKSYLEEANEEMRQEFALILWSLIPDALSKVLIDCQSSIYASVRHILELATILIPDQVDPSLCHKIAVLLSTIFSKTSINCEVGDEKSHYEYVSLTLCLYIMELTNSNQDNRVLVTYVNRSGFLARVLETTYSANDKVACAALQLLSSIIYYFTHFHYQPKTILEVESGAILRSLHRDGSNKRGAAHLQLLYMILSSVGTPIVLSTSMPDVLDDSQLFVALRALMFRIQMMCCEESKNKFSAGWKTLSAIFKHAVVYNEDVKLVAVLTTQPWLHMLIQFQMSQDILEEFLKFTNTWLTLHTIIIKKNQQVSGGSNSMICRYSLMYRTLMSLKKGLATYRGDGMAEHGQILGSVKEILDLGYQSKCEGNSLSPDYNI